MAIENGRFPLSAHLRTRHVDSAVLVADAKSPLATRFAAELVGHGIFIHQVGLDSEIEREPVVAYLVEHESALESLIDLLDQSTAPTLVLVATHELAARVLPLLEPPHELAWVTEPTSVIVWRLQRLLALSRHPPPGFADVDALTGLLNRRAFERQLHGATRSFVAGQCAAVVMLDLDQFKSINDRLGHERGDEALKAIAQLLRRRLAPEDQIARLGGDEFGCLLVRYDVESVLRDSQQLLKAVAEFQLPEYRGDPSFPRVGASAGLTFIRPDADQATLLGEADQAMYAAKCNGRSRLMVYGKMAEAARTSSRDLRLQHFENVTRVATERLVEMITLKSRRLVDAARQEANFCSLTNLRSRRYFDAQLPSEIDRARSRGRGLSLALIDLDHFHTVNMTYGWPTGDRVLQAFAGVAQSAMRSTDWTARYGGEEFVIVMPDTAIEGARHVAERVRQQFGSTTIEGVGGQQLTATLSVGVAELSADSYSATTFVDQASKALLRAKTAGRNQVETVG